MITRKHIVAIKAAQRNAGLSDEAYRDLLNREFGVCSCKDLDERDVPGVIAIINKSGARRDGWKPRQISKFRQYAKWCGMNPRQWRQWLFEHVGVTHEESPYLTNPRFDNAMATLEEELEFRTLNGETSLPERINIHYWRDRRPGFGKVNTREKHKILALWEELSRYLEEESRDLTYLRGIAAKATGRKVSMIDNLASTEALKLIEALKSKLEAEKEKIRSEVPF